MVSSPSPYNVILGGAWLYSMKAVASTLHQVVEFIGWNGRQESLRGDQLQSKKCYVSTVVQSSECLEVHCIDTLKSLALENVGISVEERSTKELIKLPINDDGSRYFLVGSSMDSSERAEMFNFLMKHIEVFAWCPSKMPGLDPAFALHSLNVNPTRHPVVQKVRRSSPLHVEAVMQEVE